MDWLQVVLLLCLFNTFHSQSYVPYVIPPVQFEVRPHEFSAWIPAEPNVTFFAFNGRLNRDLATGEPGEFNGEIKSSKGGKWIYKKTDLDLKIGDTIHFWVFVQHGNFGYRRDNQQYTIERFMNGSSCDTSTTTQMDGSAVCSGTLIFEDDFDGDSVDETKWMVDHLIPVNSKNYEFVSYQNDNRVLRVSGGKLIIRPNAHVREDDIRGLLDIRLGCTGSGNECLQEQHYYQILPPVVSARLHSKTKFRFGRIEVRAKLPSGDWIYPQVKLSNTRDETEVWIAYARGNRVYRGNNLDDIGASVLFAGLVKHAEEPKRSELLRSLRSDRGSVWTEKFHNYTVLWQQSGLSFFVDGTQFGEIKKSEYENTDIFDRELRLTIGVGVGGINDFPDGYTSASGVGKPWRNKEVKQVRKFFDAKDQWLQTWDADSQLEVDYVNIYAL